MKSMLFAALAGLISISLSSAAPKDSDSKDDTFDSLSKQTITMIENLNTILGKIKDKKSAEEAKSKFEETAKSIDDLKKRSEKLGEPSKEQKEQLEQKYKSKFLTRRSRLCKVNSFASARLRAATKSSKTSANVSSLLSTRRNPSKNLTAPRARAIHGVA